MKHKHVLIMLLSIIPIVTIAQSTISIDEALLIVKNNYIGSDVDYYLCNTNSNELQIFVDEEPMKGWEHDCCLYSFSTTTPPPFNKIPTKQTLRMPPNDILSPLDVTNRYGNSATEKPNVASANISTPEIDVAEHTYAIILSGGGNINSNHERYWNDCSFIYQTLVKKYGVPRSNINVIMSDGTNPAADMQTITGQYISSPLDLDSDGTNDIQYAATLLNIQTIFSNLSAQLEEDDHLFIYVIDHGGSIDNISNSYICLWGTERLYDNILANMLTPITNKYVNVNVVLGQCFSGGFIDDLTKVGCVVATASTGSEYSWSCSDRPYDEFVYQWTSAINKANSYGTPITSDTDNNGRVTMDEAFAYAKNNDRANESPQYISTPTSIGEDLAFNNLATSVDLYIKDNDEDSGKEPNLTTDAFWRTPNVWVRNFDDGIETHENPYYSEDHFAAMVYVRVTNRGKKTFNGTNRWVHVNWADASTGLTVRAWKGRELYNNTYVTGGSLTPAPIPPLAPGASCVLKFPWALPNQLMEDNNSSENHHFCLLARILDKSYVDNYMESDPGWYDITGKNDFAQKNVSIIQKSEVTTNTNVYVRNMQNTSHNYSLEIRPIQDADTLIFTTANVELTMSNPILRAWERGGLQYKNLSYTPALDSLKVIFTSPESKLENICLNGDEFEKVALKFDFHTAAPLGTIYSFDLIQRDENGTIVGGETFLVEAPINRVLKPVTPIEIGDGLILLETDLDGTELITEWTDTNGSVISQSNSVIVSPTLQNHNYSIRILTSEGELATGSIDLEPTNGIKSASPTTSVTDFIDIEFDNEVSSSNCFISVSSVENGFTMLHMPILNGSKVVRLDTSSLSSGLYILSYIVDGQLADTFKFSK